MATSSPFLAPAASEVRWSVRLLGGLEAGGPMGAIARWPSRAVAALLARLALAPDRAHPREELIELLWPGVALEIGRNRLRQTLSTLKGLLEPPGPQAAPVLLADRIAIRVLPGALDSDVHQFERAVRHGAAAAARALYRGELMPGHYEEWVLDERQRLASLFERLGETPERGAVSGTLGTGSPPEPVAALPPVGPKPTGLPSYWTRPFGVELTASRLRALVDAQRLVTVLGPGGSGKTRLATVVAQALRDSPDWAVEGDAAARRFDRIAFVPLVDCVDADQTLDALCGALRVEAGADGRSRIVATLSGLRALLVLDNVEQLVGAADGEIARLLSELPNLHVLVTSRRPLELDGETAFELDGLAPPADGAPLDEAAANPAVGLFVDRARAARADFRLGPRNVAAIVGLVRLLGGMPLAIELAASRVRGLTPAELLQRLSQDAGTPMLDLLARPGAHASALARHASMRHVMAWSWRQLSREQAATLGALSIAAAPLRLDAAAAIAAIDEVAAQSRLTELCDTSLMHAVEQPDGLMRYALLQPVREFAAEQIGEAGARQARARFRRWLIGFARATAAREPAAIAPELPHVHALINSGPADGAALDAVALAVALHGYWEADELPLTSVLALERALPEIVDDDDRAHVLALLATGRAAAGFAAESIAHAEAALALPLSDQRRAIALMRWARAIYNAGRFNEVDLEGPLEEAARLAERSGDLEAQVMVLRMKALVICNMRLDFATAEQLSDRALQLAQRLGNRPTINLMLMNRVTMWAWQGRNEEAIAVFAECERVTAAQGDWLGLMAATRQSGRIHIRMRRWDEAIAAFRRSIRLTWQRHHAQGLAHALMHLPEAMACKGQQLELAARLQGFAESHWKRFYGQINRIEVDELRRARRMLRLHLGGGRTEALLTEGAGLDLARVVALALDEQA